MITPSATETFALMHYSYAWGLDPASPSLRSSLAALSPLPEQTPPTTVEPAAHPDGPCLDAPKTEQANAAQLEKLLALLALENNEQQIALTKTRIEQNQQQLHVRHEAQMAKLKESLDEAAKAETSALITRVFSWLFTALSLVTAAAACVASGGVAVPAVAGAVVAVGMLTLSESGATEALVDAMTESLRSTFDCSKQRAAIGAQVVLTALMLAVSIGIMVGGGFGSAGALATKALTTSQQVAKGLQTAASIANGTLAVATTGTQGYGTVKRYEAAMAKTDATAIEQSQAALKQLLQDDEDLVQRLLEGYQTTLAALAGMLEQDAQTLHDILARIETIV